MLGINHNIAIFSISNNCISAILQGILAIQFEHDLDGGGEYNNKASSGSTLQAVASQSTTERKRNIASATVAPQL